ncbi:MAG: hypothetical protein JNG89_20225 [Planctomycetaceae bacterium]|nr:hypothetical protein [Planctomycetaceae bacterium]
MKLGTLSEAHILVVGTSAAGKTTFARKLGGVLQLPVIELDELYWGPNWQNRGTEEFSRLTIAATDRSGWIADGNYGSIRDVLWPRATLVIWLNYPLTRVLWRGITRTFRRSLFRERLWHDNRESFRRALLSRDSILLWIITTHRRRQREFRELQSNGRFPQLRWIEFSRPSQAEDWLRDIATKVTGETASHVGCRR